MIQLNLLPDVKLDFVKARNRKRTVMSLSIVVSAAFLAIFLFLLVFVHLAQKKNMNDLTTDIKSATKQLSDNEDLNKIVTIQNQLNSLPDLHNNKVISSRLFDFLSQVTPNDATISDVKIDFAANTLVVSGNANELSTVNKFADTLKFTEYKVNGQDQGQDLPKAFSSVVLSSFSINDETGDVTYELSFNFDPTIFANEGKNSEKSISLDVPNIISTRSAVEKPNDLFVPQPDSGGAN